MRGNAGQHAHTMAMGGRRLLCQSLNRELASKGVHVAHIVVDAAVDAPDTLGKMLGKELFERMKDAKGADGVMSPAAAAETYFHLHTQHRSAWSFEVDLRPYSEVPWFNS